MPDPRHAPATATSPPAVAVSPLDPHDAGAAFAVLTAAEAAAGGDLVDEAERRRLRAVAGDPTTAPSRWRPVVAQVGDEVVGYGALVLPDADGGTAIGDAAAVRDANDANDANDAGDAPDGPTVLAGLLAALRDVARDAGAGDLQVWCRQVRPDHLVTAETVGFRVHRRLGVLGRDLPVAGDPPATPDGVTIRGYRDADAGEVVRVLAAAYAGTDEAGWDLPTFRERTAWDWFRPEDLLVADAGDGRLLGVHWTKRRSPAVGEVHNLAVHPDGQGRGLGPVLLRAGLDHLAGVGCDEVVLWVDRANTRGVAVYERAGFTTRWDDVALTAASRTAAREAGP